MQPVDVTAWAVISSEDGGADQGKHWLAMDARADRVDQWLWKPRQLTGDGSEHELSDVSEVLTSQIARRLDLPAAECVYAVRDGELGVLSKNVSPTQCDLHEGRIYLEGVEGYRRNSPTFDSQGRVTGLARIDEGYTVEAVSRALNAATGPPGWQELTAMQVFSGYLVLDAFIANTDRHPGNWAVLDPWSSDKLMLAPAYDHGRAFGSGLTELRRSRVDLQKFCERGMARTFSPATESLVDLALRACQQYDAMFWLERLDALSVHALDELVSMSSTRMSADASTFIVQVLHTNRRRLCS